MKTIAVISGKGGTGKTSITAALAEIIGEVVVADCDVDAADLHILLHPEKLDEGIFQAGRLAVIDPAKCDKCGECEKACVYGAIDKEIKIDYLSCEGCGVCEFVCPHGAITMKNAECGMWYVSNTETGPMSHARLDPGKENSGKLVALVRKNAADLSKKYSIETVLIDGPPGVGCPVIASIGGVDAVMIVTEPTLSGLHDCERVAQLLAHFKIPGVVLINKCDINEEITQMIKDMSALQDLEVIGDIPYNTDFYKAQLAGKTIVGYGEEQLTEKLREVWRKLSAKLAGNND